MKREQATTVLRNLGWRVNTSAQFTQAVKDFQAGWNLGSALKVDGQIGPLTAKALATSEARRKAKRKTMSANYSFTDFRCKCGGRYAACRRIFYTRRQVQALEVFRKTAGAFVPTSGYRCAGHNRAVGGAKSSQHVQGRACDVPGRLTTAQVRRLGAFTGIGYSQRTGRVLHVDTRPGSVTSPITWRYA
jgi:zinc D-Ala-D-Ala carboxypeptidase